MKLANESRYLVFIKSEFVRDAQAYTAPTSDVIDMGVINDDDNAWRDVGGPMLVLDRVASDESAVWDFVSRVYPNTPKGVFYLERLPIKSEYISSREESQKIVDEAIEFGVLRTGANFLYIYRKGDGWQLSPIEFVVQELMSDPAGRAKLMSAIEVRKSKKEGGADA